MAAVIRAGCAQDGEAFIERLIKIDSRTQTLTLVEQYYDLNRVLLRREERPLSSDEVEVRWTGSTDD